MILLILRVDVIVIVVVVFVIMFVNEVVVGSSHYKHGSEIDYSILGDSAQLLDGIQTRTCILQK